MGRQISSRDWRPILTAEEMRAAEQCAIDDGVTVEMLMDRAGKAAADAAWLFAGPLSTLVLCGPGNNGGDGYIIARRLREMGVDVRVAAMAEPSSAAARWARSAWDGDVEAIALTTGAPLLIDALFGTGLKRPLQPEIADMLNTLAREALVKIAVDVPSGVASDDGTILSEIPSYDLTVTFGSLKPAHRLFPAAARMGRVVIADIAVQAKSNLFEIGRPRLISPAAQDHKYSRGYVVVVAGEMPGAASLAAAAAARAGAGYVRLIADEMLPNVPAAVVQGAAALSDILSDERGNVVLIGPGLGHGDKGRELFKVAVASGRPLILDGDALTILGDGGCADLPESTILTPHAGEFMRLFGSLPGSKVDQAREAARRANAMIVYKGADTIVTAPDGRAAIAPPASHWLASAGTGDVLAGVIAAMRAQGLDAFDAACAGVWLHGRASEAAGPALIADDLVHHLPHIIAECL